MEAHYTIEKLEHEWLVLVNGLPQLSCKSRKMADRIVRKATLSDSRIGMRTAAAGAGMQASVSLSDVCFGPVC